MTGTVDQGDDVRAYEARFRDWLAGAEVPRAPPDGTPDRQRARSWHRTLAGAGWLGVDWPLRDGGQGLTAAHRRVVTAGLARSGAPEPLGSVGEEAVGPTISRFGSDPQRRRFLAPMLAGEEIWAVGFAEPEVGSDARAPHARAERAGEELSLTGSATWVRGAASADWCAVVARTGGETPGAGGVAYLLVDLHAPGVTVRPMLPITGATDRCDLLFDAVRVPSDHVLDGPGDGSAPAAWTLRCLAEPGMIRRRIALGDTLAGVVASIGADDACRRDPSVAEALGRAVVTLRGLEALARETDARRDRGERSTRGDALLALACTAAERHIHGVALDLLGVRRTALGDGRTVAGYVDGLVGSVLGRSSEGQRAAVGAGLLGLAGGGTGAGR